MIVFGLTGGIGMGKSTVAGMFVQERIPAFDADIAVHELQAPGGRALPALERAFPGIVQDGVLNRARLRRLVLADDAAMRRLEAIMHPLVHAEEARFRAAALRGQCRAVVLDIPLLFETGGHALVDHVMVVSAPAKVQQARVRRRRRMSDSQIAAILAAQMPDAAKRARADTVIRTGLSRFHAQRDIRRFLARELGQEESRAGAPPPRTQAAS